MPRRIDQNGIPDPLSRDVIESFLKIGVPYRLAMLDFAEAAIPAKTTRDSAFVEAGIVSGRLLLQFLGLGIRRKGGLRLVENREYHIENASTDEVKITDVGGRFVDVASLDAATAEALAHFHNGASRRLRISLGILGTNSISTISDDVFRLSAILSSPIFARVQMRLTKRCSQPMAVPMISFL